MPALPLIRRDQASDSTALVAMVSCLPLRRHRSIPGFVLETARVVRQLARAPGLVAFSLRADLLAKTFWTFSVWQDQASLGSFARNNPHRGVVERLQPRVGATRFATFEVDGSRLPATWHEMCAPLRDRSAEHEARHR